MNSTSNVTNSNEEEQVYNGIDISFVIDSTGSMGPYIVEAKESIINIINTTTDDLKETFPDDYNEKLKFSIVAYRDHPPQDNTFITEIFNFSSGEKAISYLNSLSASGGGDEPEAVLDGLNDCVHKLSWREKADKMVFLILDACPHGIRFGSNYDCPCGLHEKDILSDMKRMNIKFFVIRKPNDDKLDKMVFEFEKYISISVKEFEKVNNSSFPLFPTTYGSGSLKSSSLMSDYSYSSIHPPINLFCSNHITSSLEHPPSNLFCSNSLKKNEKSISDMNSFIFSNVNSNIQGQIQYARKIYISKY